MENVSIKNFVATLQFGRPYAGHLLLASFLNLVTVLADLAFLYLLKRLIDTGFTPQSLAMLKWLALGALGIVLIRSAFGYASGYLFNYTSGRMTNDIQDLLYTRIQQLSLDFHTENSTGNILTLIFYHAEAMLQIISSFTSSLIKEFLRIPALIIFLFSLPAGLALFALLVFPPAVLAVRLFRKLITQTTQKIHKTVSQLYTTTEQTLSHMETVKTFAKEAEEINRFKQLNKQMFSQSIQGYKATGLSGPVIQLLKMLGVTALVFLGTRAVARNEISIGGLTTFLASAYYFYGALSNLSSWYLSLLTGMLSAEKVLEVLAKEPSVLSPSNGLILRRFEKEIVMHNVSFCYPSGKKDVLKKINLRIAKGKTAAIIGPSGSGKSTLIKILLRLYDPGEGTVVIDGHNLVDLNLAALRRLFGVAPQDPGIFQDSVAAAIAYGRSSVSLREIQEAARMVEAHEFITDLPQGYDTLIGERSVKLSGGEKQRVALARAFLRKPEVLILDEALSSVDASTEKTILQRVISCRQEQTTILITHRLASVVHADRIVVLEAGVIVEEGDHQQLMDDSKRYREWLLRQQSEKLE